MKFRRALLALLSTLVMLASLLIAVPTTEAQSPSENDAVRASAVSQIIDGLEDYGQANDSYAVVGSGFHNEGWGFVNELSGTNYTTSIGSLLSDGGYLGPGDWEQDSGSDIGDFWIYQCEDRVGVFSKADGVAPDPSDSEWWSANGCNPFGLNSLELTYFQVSAPLEIHPDSMRRAGVLQAIHGLQRYAFEQGTYRIAGAGELDGGHGWFEQTDESTYTTSLASALVEGGYLDTDVIGDPGYDLWVEPCGDRVAVFSKTDQISPSQVDARTWSELSSEHGCSDYALTTLELGYYQLSEPLRPNSCKGVTATITEAVDGVFLGTNGDDVIVGTNGDDVIRGRGGNDIICGLGGDDILYGGPGDDLFVPGTGVDKVRGHAGIDKAYVADFDANLDDLFGGEGDDDPLYRDYTPYSLKVQEEIESECQPLGCAAFGFDVGTAIRLW